MTQVNMRAIPLLIGAILVSLACTFPTLGAPAKTVPVSPAAVMRPAQSPPAEAAKAPRATPAPPPSAAPAPAAATPVVSPGGVPAQPAQPAAPNASTTAQAAEKILATVNGVNITKGDFDRELRIKGINPVGGAVTSQIIDEIFENLINGILAEQYLAGRNQLNDQQLLDQIAAMRRQVIGEYFFLSVGRNQKPLQQQDIDAFVAEHPDYFKDRRFYYYSAISYKQATSADINQLRALLFSSNNFDKIADFLSSKKITYNLFHGYLPSEKIDENVLAKLKTMSPGEGAIITSPGDETTYVIKLFSSSADPQDPEKLRVPIMNGIIVTRAGELINQVKKQMYDSADIKYIDKPKPTVVAQPGKFYAPNAATESSSGKFYKSFGQKGVGKGKIASLESGADNNSDRDQSFENAFEGSKTKSDPLARIFKNVWIFSLLILYPAAFYQFLKTSNEKYSNLTFVDPFASEPAVYREYRLKKLSLEPILTWVIGLLLLAYLGFSSWKYFFDLNLYISTKNILITATTALIGSLVLIFVMKKIYPYLPAIIRNSRFLFIGAIAILHLVIFKVV